MMDGRFGGVSVLTAALLFTWSFDILPVAAAPPREPWQCDVVVYGGTPAGIMAAIAAARKGASVVLLEQTRHVGGLSTSGLNQDESMHMFRGETFGGLCMEFLHAASTQSGAPPVTGGKAYRWQSRVAETVFLDMLKQADVQVRYKQLLATVQQDGTRLVSLKVRTGEIYQAQVFIDATYEGDLMAKAGVTYVTGRESRDEFGESLGGVIYPDSRIDVSPRDDHDNILPGVMEGPLPPAGAASPHPTCYNIRLNLTTSPENRVPITRPENYDPAQFELLARCIEAGEINNIRKVVALYNMSLANKVECNNCQRSIVSLSIPGAQTPWCEATFEQREKIHEAYRNYTHGVLWFLQSDARVPERMRKEMSQYGFCKDEWQDNGHWPWYLYVREGRRMRGRYVLTQQDIIDSRTKEDVVHLCSHFIDSHQVTRYADGNGFINEGRLWQPGKIYQFPYRALTPKQEECENLLVPVCVSSSHVAFCSIRLEPTWMHLGEVSGLAAAMCARSRKPVQELDVQKLQVSLKSAGIPLEMPASALNDQMTSEEETDQWIQKFFRTTDLDGNGTVSQTEWLKTRAEYDWLFRFIDKNRDGEISREEYVEFQTYKKRHPDWRQSLKIPAK